MFWATQVESLGWLTSDLQPDESCYLSIHDTGDLFYAFSL